MKNFFYTITTIFVLITTVSCQPDEIITEVEVPVQVTVTDSILVQQTPFGTITYTQIMQGNNVTLQPGLNHYAKVVIEDYQGFELDMSFWAGARTYVDKRVFDDGGVVIQTDEVALSNNLDNDGVVLEGVISNQISEFDIYINADLLSNSAVTEPELSLRLRKDQDLDDEQRLIWVRLDKEYLNADGDDELGLVALNGETPIELYVDLDATVTPFPNDPSFSEAEVVMEIEQESGYNLYLMVNSFEFIVDGVNYNINDLPQDVSVLIHSDDAPQFADAYLIDEGDDIDVEIRIVAPTGTTVEIVLVSLDNWRRAFGSNLHLNKVIQM